MSSGWGVLGFFVLATMAFTWPLVTVLSDSLPDWGDPPDVAWRMGVIAKQLAADPLHLYKTAAFYPLNNGIALNELLTGEGLLAAPIYWLTGNPPLAYNLLNFLSYTLSGWAMWLLVRRLTGSSGAGVVAGTIYTFSPWHYGQYGHLPLAAQQWMVLALYFLIRFLEQTRPLIHIEPDLPSPEGTLPTRKTGWNGKAWLNLGLFVVCFVLQALVAGYFAYFEALLVGLFLVYYFLFESRLLRRLGQRLRRKPLLPITTSWRQVWTVAGAIVIAGLLVLPFILPFVQAQHDYGFKRSLSEVSYWSAAPTSLLRTTDRSWLYKPVERGIFGLQTSAERMFYPGLVALILAVIGLVGKSKMPEPGRRWLFLAVGLSGLVLSFGPVLNLDAYGLNSTGIELPYKWLYGLIPGFDALRVAYRFGQLFMLGLAVCAGYGVARLLKSGRWTRWKWQTYPVGQFSLLVGLVALVTVDFFAPGLPVQPTPTGKTAPPMYRWLASGASEGLVAHDAVLLELPITQDKTPITSSPIYLLYSLSHGRPMLNGSANILPPGYERLFNEMQSFPSPATLDIVEGLGVRFVLVHTKGLSADANRTELSRQTGPGGRLELVKEFEALDGDGGFKDAIYRVKPTNRFEKFKSLIPEGSEVFLADNSKARRLYTAALPGLLGPNRRYFSTYSTIYDSQVQPAQANRVYDYAFFYRGSGALPTEYGYNPSDLLEGDPNDVIQVYHKRAGLASFFSFQDEAKPGHYLPFAATNPARLSVSDGTVQQISQKNAKLVNRGPLTNQSLMLILAAAEPQTVILRNGTSEKSLKIGPGFFRWQVNIQTPTSLELLLQGGGWAYLVQARLFTTDRAEETSEQIKGIGGAIVQANSQPQEGQPGVIASHLIYYTESPPAAATAPTYLFQVNIETPLNEAGLPDQPRPARRRFGEWAVISAATDTRPTSNRRATGEFARSKSRGRGERPTHPAGYQYATFVQRWCLSGGGVGDHDGGQSTHSVVPAQSRPERAHHQLLQLPVQSSRRHSNRRQQPPL